MKSYFIKEGYNCNLTPQGNRIEQYKTIPNNAPYQVACYQYAAALMKQNGWERCLELGSGSGFKLDKYIRPVAQRVVGIDLPHAVEYCKKMYPGIEWLSDDFDSPQAALPEPFDLIISFDVIEHLINPELLLKKIKQYASPFTKILISTPERDLLNGKDNFGPPHNKLHVREWNQEELKQFLLSEGFSIEMLKILDARKLTIKQQISQFLGRVNYKTCQLYECSYK